MFAGSDVQVGVKRLGELRGRKMSLDVKPSTEITKILYVLGSNKTKGKTAHRLASKSSPTYTNLIQRILLTSQLLALTLES